MIEIDGSYGEGGGQILRTAVSLSALTLRPVKITKIRSGRPQPGLKHQHLAGIDLTGQLVHAKIRGLEVGSTEVEFTPTERSSGLFEYDVGTAGSIGLVLQAVLPPAILSDDPVRLQLTGGTDVAWSPSIDYLREVFVPMLNRMGPRPEIRQERRGHYPKGGGKVSVDVTPCEEISPIALLEFGKLLGISGISHCVRLPSHVAERQARSAEKALENNGLEVLKIDRESYDKRNDPHLGPGSGIVLWAESTDGVRLGADSLGERGKRAEQVGYEAAQGLIRELASGKPIDSHLCDMLAPYMALAKGESRVGVTEITSHLTTNIWVAQQILGVEISLQGQKGQPGLLTVRGIGFLSR
jgi:RNA 3'-phosphate cyclase